MTFLMMLFVILLSMLMILLSTLSVIRHQTSGLEFDLWDSGRKWRVDFKAVKTQLVSFDRPNNTSVIDVKVDGSLLADKSYFKRLGLSFSSKLNWGTYIISITKTPSKNIGVLIYNMRFLSLEIALYLSKFTIWPCMEYCDHV